MEIETGYRSTKKHERLLQVLVPVLVAVVTLLALESLSRLLEPKPYDGFNSASREMLSKRPGEYTVFVYGESTVYGIPEPALGFVEQLKFWLQKSSQDRQFKVVNFGRPALPSARILKIVEHTIGAQPDLAIVLMGHNEFLDRSVHRQSWLPECAEKLASVRLGRLYLSKLFSRFKRLEPFERQSSLFEAKVSTFRDNLTHIVERIRDRGVPLILCTAPANLLDWPPVYKKLPSRFRSEGYESAIANALELASQRNWQQALAEVEAILGTYQHDAMALYLLGRIRLSLGSYGHAKELFIRAKDRDPMPWRALSEFNDFMRQEASKPHVHLVDVSKAFEDAAAYGIPGFRLVGDNCHPTPAGHALIVYSILSKVAELSLIKGFDRMLPDCCTLDTYLETLGDGLQRELLMSVLLKTGQYAMQTPFLNYSAARMYFDHVVQLDADNWVAWANLGSLSLLEGKRQQGLRQLGIAQRLKKAPLDGRDRRSHPYLVEALRAAHVDEAEIR